MRSRAARLSLAVTALIAFVVAGFLAVDTDHRIATERDGLRAFELNARDTANGLAEIRAAQQAYVSAGQGTAFWMPKVTSLIDEVTPQVDQLRASATNASAQSSLMEAAAQLTEIGNVDRRVRDYLRSGQTLMASDVVFTEGNETAINAAQLVESAREAEHQQFDANEAGLRRRQAAFLGGAIGFGVFAMLALAWVRPERETIDSEPAVRSSLGDISMKPPAQTSSVPRGSVPMLRAAADVCVEIGRATSAAELAKLLSRTADIIDATGMVVWLGDLAGGDLRLVLSHGYSEAVIARMATIPRSADNAAAAAYRSGKLQIVLKRPGSSNGAVAAPLLTTEGCVGALTAEIQSGSEVSEAVQAVTTLVAAQLTGIVAASLAAAPPKNDSGRVASA
jgi:hypothetical protein